MTVQYNEVQELLRSRADLHARLNLMPYDGTPEIKERGGGKYLYVRKHLEYGVINDVFQVFFCYNYDILGLRGCRTLRRKEYAGSRKKRENNRIPLSIWKCTGGRIGAGTGSKYDDNTP